MSFCTRRRHMPGHACMARSLFAGTEKKKQQETATRSNVIAQLRRHPIYRDMHAWPGVYSWEQKESNRKQRRATTVIAQASSRETVVNRNSNAGEPITNNSGRLELHADDLPSRHRQQTEASRSSCRSTCAWRPPPCTRRRGTSRSGTR